MFTICCTVFQRCINHLVRVTAYIDGTCFLGTYSDDSKLYRATTNPQAHRVLSARKKRVIHLIAQHAHFAFLLHVYGVHKTSEHQIRALHTRVVRRRSHDRIGIMLVAI